MDKGEIIAIALAVLPHIVALIPGLAKGEGIISAVLNFLSGNYGAAKNGK
jgi:hypothetical protein